MQITSSLNLLSLLYNGKSGAVDGIRLLAGVTALRGGAARGLSGRQDFRPSLLGQQHSIVHASAYLQVDPHRGYVRERFASRNHVYE